LEIVLLQLEVRNNDVAVFIYRFAIRLTPRGILV